ncbi:peptidyl-prolyl cis-trans isomerase [Arcobacteraceae bacterium]|nr:peptidyl-prolyl cis-trans isomerase [Arcobacteraceae bacterium]
MNKIILSILLAIVSLQAGLVNAIAITVNETPITLYDIDKEMETKNINKNDAVSRLIDDILYQQSLSSNHISVDTFDIDSYIEKLAASNKMNVFDFKSLVRQQENYTLFKEKIKKQIIHQKLIAKISNGKLIIATEEDLKIYYKNNEEQFKIADTIEVVAYVSKNKKLLQSLKSNPMLQNAEILVQDITMKQSELNPQTKYILNSTKEKMFSAIFAQNKNYNMFYLKEKKDITTLSFEDVKEKIFQIIMKKREQDYLKEYFETSKITADIKVLR